jgi:hypothetical protein
LQRVIYNFGSISKPKNIRLFKKLGETAEEGARAEQLAPTVTMPELDISNFNLACAILGGFTTLFGLVSYVVKHKIYLSEASEYGNKLYPES